MKKPDEKDDVMSLEIKVSLQEIQDYEMKFGKKISEMSLEEKSELFQRLFQTRQQENEKNTFNITASFNSSDPELENERLRHIKRKKDKLNIIKCILYISMSVVIVLTHKDLTNLVKSYTNELLRFFTILIYFKGFYNIDKIYDREIEYIDDKYYNTGASKTKVFM